MKHLLFSALLCFFYCLPFCAASHVTTETDHSTQHTTGDSYDLHYHRLELEIDPAVKFIKGGITSLFTVKAGSTVLTFDLSDVMVVDSVVYHATQSTFTHSSDLLSIPISIAPVSTLDSVKVYYHGVPAHGFNFQTQTYWDHSDATKPIAFSDSEPYDSHYWWPCKQSLTDKIDSIDFLVTTPAQYKVASNGILYEEINAGAWTTYHWKHRYPIATYVIACSISDYVVYTDLVPLPSGRQVQMINYVFPSNEQAARDSTAKLIAVLQLLDSLLGPYPFEKEKFGHAQAATGMENQTMSFVGDFDMGILAHELTHQWFGDKVTCGSWHEIWLNEGFATYMPMVVQEAGIETGLTTLEYRTQLNRLFVPYDPYSTVFVGDTSNARQIFSNGAYEKGAMILHMLRRQIGTEAFFQGLRNYLSDPDLAYGFGSVDKLKQHLEGTSGISLDNFFSEWYYGEGYPVFDLQWNQDSGTLFLYVPQGQSTNIDFFHDVPLQLTFSNADRSLTFDTTLYTIKDHEYFTFNPGFDVDTIQFDVQKNILADYTATLDHTLQLASVRISSTASDPTQNAPIPVALSFTETMTGFDVGDLIVDGASISNFHGDGRDFTFDLNPTATGMITVYLPGNSVLSINGNKNATAEFHITYEGNVTEVIDALPSSKINIYPVPASSSLTLTAGGQNIDRYEIWDLLGQPILAANPAQETVHVDTSTLKTGMYVVLIWTPGNTLEKKVFLKR